MKKLKLAAKPMKVETLQDRWEADKVPAVFVEDKILKIKRKSPQAPN